jgi:hypothetical protein
MYQCFRLKNKLKRVIQSFKGHDWAYIHNNTAMLCEGIEATLLNIPGIAATSPC